MDPPQKRTGAFTAFKGHALALIHQLPYMRRAGKSRLGRRHFREPEA
jgi:hypothetical protein